MVYKELKGECEGSTHRCLKIRNEGVKGACDAWVRVKGEGMQWH